MMINRETMIKIMKITLLYTTMVLAVLLLMSLPSIGIVQFIIFATIVAILVLLSVKTISKKEFIKFTLSNKFKLLEE